MEDLFRQFWWIIFPMFGLAMGGWHSFAQFRNQQKKLDIIRTYAERGEQPPEALLASLNVSEENEYGSARGRTNYWALTGLFAVLTAGFSYGAYISYDGGTGAFMIVALVMGAVALWALICALMQRRNPR